MHRGPDVARLGQGQGHEHLLAVGVPGKKSKKRKGRKKGWRVLKARLGGNIM